MTDITKNSQLSVDTNLLVYLTDDRSSYNKRIIAFFEWCEVKNIVIVCAHQSILELIRTFIGDYGLPYLTAENKAKELMSDKNIRVISPLPSTLATYFLLTKANVAKRGNMFDYYLAATVLDNGIDTMVTNNKEDFVKIKGLKVYDLEDIGKLMKVR